MAADKQTTDAFDAIADIKNDIAEIRDENAALRELLTIAIADIAVAVATQQALGASVGGQNLGVHGRDKNVSYIRTPPKSEFTTTPGVDPVEQAYNTSRDANREMERVTKAALRRAR